MEQKIIEIKTIDDSDRIGSFRTGTLPSISAEEIEEILKIPANDEGILPDTYKVNYEWQVNVTVETTDATGQVHESIHRLGVWDYKYGKNLPRNGKVDYSLYDPDGIASLIFGERVN